jgi:DNA polymerase-4
MAIAPSYTHPTPPMPPRIIAHLDMDAFFAAVEVLDCPELAGHPLIVGGAVARGVVSAASYEARRFGIHSAQPMTEALRRCPTVIVRPVRGDRYRAVSRQIMALLEPYTPLLEQVSVDEAYLDLTDWLPHGATPAEVAAAMQAQIARVTGLTCSIGVATGKAIAKMASDLRKPCGLVLVPPGEEAAFLAPLSIGKLRGVGAATERKLRELGVETIGDLARLPERLLSTRFGAPGHDLWTLAHGVDDSPVVPERQAKSIGREVTFAVDVTDRDFLERTLLSLTDDVSESLRRHGLLARGVTLKVRDEHFATRTHAFTLVEPADTTAPLWTAARALLTAHLPTRPVRLIGITATALHGAADRQLSLFAEPRQIQDRRLTTALDAVRARFGDAAITRARLAKPPPPSDAGA